MVAGECQRHHWTYNSQTTLRHDTFGNPTYRKNGSLRRIEDRLKRINVIHSEIGEGKCAVGDVGWAQPVIICACDEILPPHSKFTDTECIRVMDHGHNQAILDPDCQTDIDRVIEVYPCSRPTRVQAWMSKQCRSDKFDKEIRISRFQAVRFFDCRDQAFPHFDERARPDLAHEKEMRRA